MAARFCDRLVLLQEGRVLAEGMPQEQVLTPKLIAQAFGVKAAVYRDPNTGSHAISLIGPADSEWLHRHRHRSKRPPSQRLRLLGKRGFLSTRRTERAAPNPQRIPDSRNPTAGALRESVRPEPVEGPPPRPVNRNS